MTGRRYLISISLIALAVVVAFLAKRSVERLAPPSWGRSPGVTFSRGSNIAGETLVAQQFAAPMPELCRIDEHQSGYTYLELPCSTRGEAITARGSVRVTGGAVTVG